MTPRPLLLREADRRERWLTLPAADRRRLLLFAVLVVAALLVVGTVR